MPDDSPDCKHVKNESHFMTGMVMGVLLGGVVAYVYSSPDGKKRAKELIEEGTDMLKDLSEQAQDVGAKSIKATNSFAEQVREAHEGEGKDNGSESMATQLKQKFFKKNGKKLS